MLKSWDREDLLPTYIELEEQYAPYPETLRLSIPDSPHSSFPNLFNSSLPIDDDASGLPTDANKPKKRRTTDVVVSSSSQDFGAFQGPDDLVNILPPGDDVQQTSLVLSTQSSTTQQSTPVFTRPSITP